MPEQLFSQMVVVVLASVYDSALQVYHPLSPVIHCVLVQVLPVA